MKKGYVLRCKNNKALSVLDFMPDRIKQNYTENTDPDGSVVIFRGSEKMCIWEKERLESLKYPADLYIKKI